MIVSKSLKYVYIAIPRTGSKSMCQWLVDHYGGEWHGGHHDWRVPDEFCDFHVFTVVRNPYEIQASGWYFTPVIDPPEKTSTYAEACRNWQPPDDRPVAQKQFIEWSGISQILYFEHMPACLAELPFVNPADVPAFPHLNAGGYRPAGSFFEIMAEGDEGLVWENSKEDFEFLGYERYDPGPPKALHPRLHLADGGRHRDR